MNLLRVVFLYAVILFFSGCDISASITELTLQSVPSPAYMPPPVASPSVSILNASIQRTTANNYSIEINVGASVNSVQRTTNSGYKVEFVSMKD